MSKKLSVFFSESLTAEKLIGYFEKNTHGKNVFRYDSNYLASLDSAPISVSMPLQEQAFDPRTTHNFFAGILPEDQTRKTIARILGISANNDYSMLEKLGGECAGALSIRADEATSKYEYKYKRLTDEDLSNILQELPKRPLLAGEFEIRLSLAGVQDKLPVAVHEDQIYLPLNGAPSTHILKPEIKGFDFSTVVNEAYCLKLAEKIGLLVAPCNVVTVDKQKILLVKRYDRLVKFSNAFEILRFHQEDFCQALNIAPEDKYQNEGGPTLQDCFELLRKVSTPIENIPRLLDAIFFNFIVGNCDAHGKNFSLLYFEDKINMAPLYDILCTIIYPDLSKKMAMKIGSEYALDKIHKNNFDKLFEKCGLNNALSWKRFSHINDLVLENFDQIILSDEDYNLLAKFIQKRAEEIKSSLLKKN